jgi:coenzyme F420 biosynthesis associated uncharacterized protein
VTSVVDWGLADRVAGAMIAGLPGRGPATGPGYAAAEVEDACAEALDAAAAYAGLGSVDAGPVPELIDRRAWARNALATLAAAAAPIEERVAAELDLPGPLGPLARRGVGAAVGTEAGVAAGYAAKRVLGQYDVAVVGAARPARLLFVAENMEAARRELDADRGVFLRWVALHECTHVVQFERVEWLAAHMRALATGLIDGATEGLDPAGLAATARRLLRDPREVVRALFAGELSRLLADPQRRKLLDRLQATMCVIEGHAEHVMDAAATDLGPGLADLRRRMDERRGRRGGLGELIARLFGMELKLRQYADGKAFCDAVVAEAGPDALRTVWRSPADLPDLRELKAPRRWLRRVTAAPVTGG